MRLRGKLLAGILCALTLLTASSVTYAKYSDVEAGSYYENAINDLSLMKIITGYDDGTFKPNDNITRAQLMKLLIVATGKEDIAKQVENYSTFSDVESWNWATGYINAGVKENIITGYADGTFRPQQEVTFAQLVTVLLRALGYDSTQITGVWPQNYIQKAKALEITKGLDFNPEDKVTRADVAVMLQRTINTEINASTKTLGEQSGIGSLKTCIITNSYDLSREIPTGAVKTDSGTYISANFIGIDNLGKKVNLLVDSNNHILSIQKVLEDNKVLFIDNISGNKISFYCKEGYDSINLQDDTEFYYNGSKYSFKDIKQNVSIGSLISLAYVNNEIHYGVMVDPPTSEPVIVKKGIGTNDRNIDEIDISEKGKIKVIKDGRIAGLSEIKLYDAIYEVKNPFDKNSKILFVYDNKLTGTYDEALPSKNSANSIKIIGSEVKIGTSLAASKLNENEKAFNIGDQITAILGSKGEIIDVISPNSIDISNIAVIVDAREQVLSSDIDAERRIYYVKLYHIDGTVKEYETNKRYSSNKGNIVKFDVIDDIAIISPLESKKVYGSVNKEDKTIGDTWVAENALMLDVQFGSNPQEVIITKVNWNDMPSALIESYVTHAEFGGPFNDVQLLIVKLPAYSKALSEVQYGLIFSKPGRYNMSGDVVGQYTLVVNGKKVYHYSDKIFGSKVNEVIRFELYQDSIRKMVTLAPKDSSNIIQAVDSRRIKINDKIFRLAKDVQVYDITDSTPKYVPIKELSSGEFEKVEVYSAVNDSSVEIVQVITIIRK